MARKKRTTRPKATPASHLPKGWTLKRVRAIAAHYDNQPDDAAIAEDEATYHANESTTMLSRGQRAHRRRKQRG